MSAFLGPIHYWLFNKITLQEKLTSQILTLKEDEEIAKNYKDIYKDAEVLKIQGIHTFGEPITGALEDHINHENIHGWLQTKIESAEYRLAYSVTTLLNEELMTLSKMEEIFYNSGQEAYNKLEEKDLGADDLYKVIFDHLLEGMPCDRVTEIKESSEDEIVWQTLTCIHKKYWTAVDGDVTHYYTLRSAWIRGFLYSTQMHYERTSDGKNSIRRGV